MNSDIAARRCLRQFWGVSKMWHAPVSGTEQGETMKPLSSQAVIKWHTEYHWVSYGLALKHTQMGRVIKFPCA